MHGHNHKAQLLRPGSSAVQVDCIPKIRIEDCYNRLVVSREREIFTRFRCLTIMYATGNDDDNLVLGKITSQVPLP